MIRDGRNLPEIAPISTGVAGDSVKIPENGDFMLATGSPSPITTAPHYG